MLYFCPNFVVFDWAIGTTMMTLKFKASSFISIPLSNRKNLLVEIDLRIKEKLTFSRYRTVKSEVVYCRGKQTIRSTQSCLSGHLAQAFVYTDPSNGWLRENLITAH